MSHKDIINSVIPTERSQELVRKIIPVLVGWAKYGLTNKTYGDLIQTLGYTRSGIGTQLGNVQDVIDKLKEVTGENVPTLNSLVKRPNTGIPAEGFDYVENKYSSLSMEGKRTFVAGIDSKAVNYPKWDWVLNELGLKQAKIFTSEELERISTFGKGGEGEEHKAIKDHIYNNPGSIDIKNVSRKETEYILPSGDRLDVYFEQGNGNRIAVEVKPSTSPDEDITRGIFQCVKYKAVLEAMRKVDYGKYEVLTLLVIAGSMSGQNKQLAEALEVEVVENYN